MYVLKDPFVDSKEGFVLGNLRTVGLEGGVDSEEFEGLMNLSRSLRFSFTKSSEPEISNSPVFILILMEAPCCMQKRFLK